MFEINTQRLTLRDLSINDLPDIEKICLDVEVTKYIDYIKFDSSEKVRDWLLDKVGHNQASPRFSYNLAIVERSSEEVIGWIGIGKPSSPNKGDLDFGYALKKESWGKGYASEALKGLIDFCFSNLKVKKITGACDVNNLASEKVMLKVGMSFTGITKENGDTDKNFCILNPSIATS